jgi:hypothetical protein
MQATVTNTTDGKHIGNIITTDLINPITFADGEEMQIVGRLHAGNGVWRLWNSNYIIEINEVING